MAKITLEIEDKDTDTVMTILNNLKAGLIKNIVSDKNKEQKPLPSSSSKYLSRDAYKEKLHKKR